VSRKRPAPRTGAATQPALWAGATDEPAGSAGPSCPVQPERDVRVKRAQRGQITWGRVDLDAKVPANHEVRAIAAVVDKLDLRGLYADVRARGEIAGAPATDPKILLGLWVSTGRCALSAEGAVAAAGAPGEAVGSAAMGGVAGAGVYREHDRSAAAVKRQRQARAQRSRSRGSPGYRPSPGRARANTTGSPRREPILHPRNGWRTTPSEPLALRARCELPSRAS